VVSGVKRRKEVPLSEITLRKFEKPYGDEKELLRKFCISLGLLQPGDSRDSIVEIVAALLKARKQRRYLTSEEIVHNISVSKPNLRRHLRRLGDIGIIEKRENRYRIREFLPFKEILVGYTQPFLIKPAFDRIIEYADHIDSL
jgi:DNA-binding transcriptional ArsR family regulator